MTPELQEKILGLIEAANPSYEQRLAILAGWDTYFQRMEIDPNHEADEFRGIMTARVYSGIISCVAPDLDHGIRNAV